MSDTILSTRWIVYYDAENRQKRITRDTTVTPTVTDTVNAVYSALQSLFDELNQMDDGTPMSAQTPTAYTIGIIDAGDSDPWYIDQESTEYLTGGAVSSANWARVEGTNTGIVRMDYTETIAFIAGDIGTTITMTADGDSGTILDYNDQTTPKQLIIRPDTSASSDSFDDTTPDGAFTCGGTGTGTQLNGAATTGEWLYSNITSVGLTALQSNTTLAVFQNGSTITSYKNTTDWWGTGNIDLLVSVKKDDTLVDEGFLTVVAKRPSTTHSYFITDVSAGGSNPIPLAAGADLDDTDGYREMVLADSGGAFTVGEIIQDDTDALIQGVVTSIAGTNPTVTLEYYLIGDPLSDFTGATGTFAGQSSTGSGTAVAPSNVNGAIVNGITVTHANTGVDVDSDGTSERYSVTVDCNSNTFPTVYTRLKYLTRRGETSTSYTDGIEGQQYLGMDYRIAYDTLTGSLDEGTIVTQLTSGATGTIIGHHTTEKILTLRNSRGTFNDSNDIRYDGSNFVDTPVSTGITPIAGAPFGTYPGGGTFFFAPGVVPINVESTEVNNYSVTDDTGTVYVEPTSVSVTIGNTRALDRIAVFRLTGAGGTIDKAEYSATVQVIGDVVFNTDTGGGITADTPGKSTGGIIRLVDTSAAQEYRLRFDTWTGSTFNLSDSNIASADAATSTTIQETGAFTTSKIGDLVYNNGNGHDGVSYIGSITDNDNVTISPAITGQTSTDNIDLNVIPFTLATDDTAYVPIIDAHETTGTSGAPGTEGISMVYLADVAVRVRARQAGDILPYEADATIGTTGLSNNVIRTTDTIFV